MVHVTDPAVCPPFPDRRTLAGVVSPSIHTDRGVVGWVSRAGVSCSPPSPSLPACTAREEPRVYFGFPLRISPVRSEAFPLSMLRRALEFLEGGCSWAHFRCFSCLVLLLLLLSIPVVVDDDSI